MNRQTFEKEIMRAKTMITAGDDQDYWIGYQRGLRRNFFGENFGTEGEHKVWLSLLESPDQARSKRGQGYIDGYNAN